MPSAAQIVLADALATPVNHTFVPIGPNPKNLNEFIFEEVPTTGSLAGAWRITHEVVRPAPAKAGESTANRTVRVKIGFHMPVMETLSNNSAAGIAPAPTLSYVVRFFGEFVIPERAVAQNRYDIRKMIGTLFNNNTQVMNMIETLAPVY